TAADLHEAVLALGRERPEALVGIAVLVVLLGALAMAGPIKMVARMAAVRAVFGVVPPRGVVRPFTRSLGRRRMGSILLATLGTVSFLASIFVLFLAVQEKAAWQEVLRFGTVAVVALGIGALGLGRVVTTKPPEEWEAATAGPRSTNGFEILTSALV